MSRFGRRRRKKLTLFSEVSLTPLIDTALTLLIIFMVTTPMMQNAIKVNLPKGQVKEEGDAKQDLVVYIDKDERLFFNGTPITNDKLVQEITKKVGRDKERTVFIKADQGVRYGLVIETVDRIKVVGGVEYVALATQKLA